MVRNLAAVTVPPTPLSVIVQRTGGPAGISHRYRSWSSCGSVPLTQPGTAIGWMSASWSLGSVSAAHAFAAAEPVEAPARVATGDATVAEGAARITEPTRFSDAISAAQRAPRAIQTILRT